MSLINDALRRAKDAQQEAPSPPAPHLPYRPVEPAPRNARRRPGLLLSATLSIGALLVFLLACHWVQKGDSTRPIEVNARMARTPRALPAPPTPSASPATDATGLALAAKPASRPSPDTDTTTGSAANNTPAADDQPSEVTNTAALTPPPPPQPAPLRLQAIIFNPSRPSAMISGKTLFVGDKLGDLRVMAIDRQSITLAGAGQTNVLSLSE